MKNTTSPDNVEETVTVLLDVRTVPITANEIVIEETATRIGIETVIVIVTDEEMSRLAIEKETETIDVKGIETGMGIRIVIVIVTVTEKNLREGIATATKRCISLLTLQNCH
jgi:hypothetical protein